MKVPPRVYPPDPNDNNADPSDAPRIQARSDQEWEQHRRLMRTGGGDSTVSSWGNNYSLDDLLSKVQAVSPSARKTTDAAGREVIQVHQGFQSRGSTDPAFAHIHLDAQTGGISVNNPNNPSGGFAITDRITDLNPLRGQTYSSREEFLGAASKAGVYQTKEQVLLDAIKSRRSIVDTARKNAVAMMQEDGSPHQSYDPMETSPQARVRWASSIALPLYQKDEQGAQKKLHANDYAEFLNETGAKDFFGVKGGSARLTPIQPYMAASYAQDDAGKFDMNKDKRTSQQGTRSSRPLYLSPSPSGAAAVFTSPFRFEGAPEASKGYKQRYLYTMHNVLNPEGQAWVREDAGLLRTGFTRTVDLPEGGLDALGISANTLYGAKGIKPAEGQQTSDDIERLQQVLGRNFGSYQGVSVDDIRVEGNQAVISGGAYVGMSGTSRKFMQKAMAAVTPDSSGIIPEGYDVVMAMPDAKDIMGVGNRALAARYSSTSEFRNVFNAYATGYENLNDERKAWVDENASWIKSAPNAGGVSYNAANKMFNGGVIGGKNAPIFGNMARDFAMSQMSTHEWNDQIIDAATYEMHQGTMIGDKPMFENVQQISGEGASALYRVGTMRDYVLDTEVYDQFQPEFDRDVATLPAESLDNMARYNPGMFNYIKRLETMGAFQNPAADIITAVRANYAGEVGQNARERLSGRRAPINLDSENIDFSQMYTEATQSMQGAAPGEIDRAFLEKVAERTGNRALQMGNITLPSAKAALSTLTMNREGELVSNVGSAITKALISQSNLQQARQLGGGEDLERERDTLAYGALQEAAALMEPENSSAEEFIKKATGITMPVIAGAAIGSKMLAPGTVAIPEARLFEMTGAQSDEERQQVLDMISSGGISAMTQMFPEANSAHSSIQSRIMTVEQINKMYGKDVLSKDNVMYMSEQNAFALAKDFDRDTMRTILSGRFMGSGSRRHLVTANVEPQSSEEIARIVEGSVGGEIGKQRERAAWTAEQYASGVKYNPKTTEEIGKMQIDTLEAKAAMGTMYNFGIRGFTRFSNILADRAGVTFGDRADKVREAMAGFSQYPYQAAIDLEVDSDASLRKVSEMAKSLNWESSKGLSSSSWYASEGEGVEVAGGKNKNTLAADIMKTFASIGLDSAGIDMSTDEGRASAKERADKYRKFLAPHLAVGMLPINATDEQQAAALRMLNERADEFEQTGSFGAFDTRQFATEVAGKKNELHWLVGGQGEDLASSSPLAAYLAGTSAERLDQRNPGKKGSKIGLQPVYQEMVQQTRAFFEGKNASNVEESFSAIEKQAREVTPQTRSAIQRMGGAAPAGTSALQSIQRVDPQDSENEAEKMRIAAGDAADTYSDPTPVIKNQDPVKNTFVPIEEIEAGRAVGAKITPDNGYPEPAPDSGGSGGGSGQPPIAPPAPNAPEPPSGSGQHTVTNNTRNVYKFTVPNLREMDVKSAFSHLDYLQDNYGRIKDIGALIEAGGDITPVVGEIKAIRKAARSVQGTYNAARMRRDAGYNTPADRLAEPMIEAASDHNVDAFWGVAGERLDQINDAFTKHELQTTASRKSALPRVTDTDEAAATTAISRLSDLSQQFQELTQATEGFTKVQKDHLTQVRDLSKSYKELEKAEGKYEAAGRAGTLTEEQSAVLDQIRGLKTDNRDAIKGLLSVDAQRRTGMLQSPTAPISDEEHQQKMLDALLSGGRSGVKKRMRLTDEDWERGLELGPLNISDEGTLRALGGAARLTSKAQGAMWAATHLQHNIIQPMAGLADMYMERQGQRDMAMLQSGAISYDEMMSGVGGQMRRRMAQGAVFQEEIGRQVYNSYFGMLNPNAGEVGGRNVGGAMSIFSPALGGAVIGGQFGPLGSAVGAVGGLAFGAVNYFTQSTQDLQGLASNRQVFMDNMKGQPDNIFGRIGGAIKTLAQDPLGSISSTFASLTNRELVDQAQDQANLTADAKAYVTGSGLFMQSSTVGQVSETLQGMYGATRGNVEGTILNEYVRAKANQGISQDEALNFYSFQRMFAPNVGLNDRMFKQIEQLSISGVTQLPQDAVAFAQAMGYSATDTAGVSEMTHQLGDYFTQRIAGGQNGILASQRLRGEVLPIVGQINQARRQSGRDLMDWQSVANSQFVNDPARLAGFAQLDVLGSEFYQSNEALGKSAGVGRFNYQAATMLYQNDMLGFNRVMRQGQTAFGMANNYMTYGMGVDQASEIVSGAAGLSSTQFNRFQAAAGGNRLILSQMAQSGQLAQRYNTIDLQTGADAFQYGINGAEYQNIQQYAQKYGMADMLGDRQMMAGGMIGMQRQVRDLGLRQQQMQYQNQMDTMNIGYQMMTGGATQLDAQGFAVGGDNLNWLGGLFRSQGKTLNIGNGMGMWQIQDAQERIQREKAMFQITQGTQSINLQQQQFDLAGKQFYEKWDLNNRQFQYNTNYQRSEMGIQREQSLTQREWTRADMSFQRDQSELGFGWQMEDFDRNIRYARGRERLDLMRQKNRAVISHSMEIGQMDRQESRFEERSKWEDDLYKRQKEHFEKTTEFRKEEMDMQKRHFEEGRDLDKQRLDMQKQSHDKEIAWMQQQWRLEDQRRLIERQQQTLAHEMQTRMTAATYQTSQEVRRLEESMNIANQAMQANVAALQMEAETGRLASTVLMAMNGNLQQTAAQGQQTAGALQPLPPLLGQTAVQLIQFAQALKQFGAMAGKNMMPPSSHMDGGYLDADFMMSHRGQTPREFREGGYTGDGLKGQAAGIVHKGEYVVPQNGSLVVRGDNEGTIHVLKEILSTLKRIEAMGPGRVEATIHTNAASIRTSDFTPTDKAYSAIRQQ